MLTHIQVDFTPDETNLSLEIFVSVRTPGQTGVEMEVLDSGQRSPHTYDACKAIDNHDLNMRNLLLAKYQRRSLAEVKADFRPGRLPQNLTLTRR